MAPQESIPLAATVLGTIGTVFWCIQLLPQIWYNWRQKKTDGLPAIMMFLWAISAVPCGVYTIVQKFNLPIQIQPQIFCALSLVSWGQILHYNNHYNAIKAALVSTAVGVSFGAAELLLILTLRPLYERGISWPIMTVGIMAAILLAAGLLPPYQELWKRKGRVVGIHFGFLTVDWLGAFFSLMGVATQTTFDPLGGCLFIVCLVIEGGIFVSHGIWLLRTRKIRAAAKAAGKSFDDIPESEPYHVDIPRAGSIAAARDTEAVEVERRGSIALAKERDLEACILPRGSIARDVIAEESSIKRGRSGSQAGVIVTELEVRPSLSGQGVEEIDYGTIPKRPASRKRPGFARQDTGGSLFPGKDPDWGPKQ